MFGFLKDKLKDVKEKFSTKIEEEGKEETVEKEVEEEKPKEEPSDDEDVYEKQDLEELEENDEITPNEGGFMEGYDKSAEEEKPKENILKKITKKVTSKRINEKQFEEIFWELEVGLLESNVAIEVIEKIKKSLKMDLVDVDIDKSKINNIIEKSLRESIEELFDYKEFDIVEVVKKAEKPYVIAFVGPNGNGKTTTIAKFGKLLKDNGLKVVFGASDTFRAAAIDQLSEHGNNLDIKVIKHDYGADPSAVAFDAIKYAKLKELDVVLIDTAGRMHSNTNLLEELKKLVRVNTPNMKIFVGESITGNDAVVQAKAFDDAVGIDGVILSKADIDEKGGAALSVNYVTGKPILYLGTGQEYGDLEKFNMTKFMASLGW